MTGIAAGHEYRVDPRKPPENFAPLLQRRRHCRGVGVIRVHRRIPNPALQAVLLRQSRHLHHHLHRRKRKMRTVGRIVRSRRNQLDRVGAEHRQVPYVALPHRNVPPIVRVGLRPVAQLMAAQRVPRRRLDIQRTRQRHRVAPHFERAQQPAHAEQNPALVIARDLHARRPAVVERAQSISLRRQPTARRGAPDRHHRRAASGIRRRSRPRDPRPFPYRIDQQRDRLALRTAQVRRRHHRGMSQVTGESRRHETERRQQEAVSSGHGC